MRYMIDECNSDELGISLSESEIVSVEGKNSGGRGRDTPAC